MYPCIRLSSSTRSGSCASAHFKVVLPKVPRPARLFCTLALVRRKSNTCQHLVLSLNNRRRLRRPRWAQQFTRRRRRWARHQVCETRLQWKSIHARRCRSRVASRRLRCDLPCLYRSMGAACGAGPHSRRSLTRRTPASAASAPMASWGSPTCSWRRRPAADSRELRAQKRIAS
jgi:hypothetical protein